MKKGISEGLFSLAEQAGSNMSEHLEDRFLEENERDSSYTTKSLFLTSTYLRYRKTL